MKAVFLDVDGVLNYIGCPFKIGSIYFVDDKKLKLLKQLIDRTGAKVVLSSTWRIGWFDLNNDAPDSMNARDFITLERKCHEHGIAFMSMTPILQAPRGEEIVAWLHRWKGQPVESFVILDDDNDMQPYMDKLVQTDATRGLTQEDIDRACKILGEV